MAARQPIASPSGPSAKSATPMPIGQELIRIDMARMRSLPSNQSATILVRSTFSITAPTPLATRAISASSGPAALVAAARTEKPAGQRDDDPGQEIDADQPAELRVVQAELRGDEGRERGDRLELEAHAGACEGQRGEDLPACAHR